MKTGSYGAVSGNGQAPTLARFVKEVYRPQALAGYSSHWRERVEQHLDTLLLSSLASSALDTIRPLDVSRWWSAQVSTGHNRQANMLRQRLRLIFKYALALELIEKDPTRHLPKARENGGRVRSLSTEQRDRLLTEAKRTNERIYRYIVCAIYTMARRRSLLTLKEGDIDLARGLVTLHRTKTGKDVTVPLHPALAEEVAGWLTGNPDSLLLYPYHPNALSLAFRRIALRAGITDFHFHDLRHDTATRLVNTGTDLVVLKALGGWDTMAMVARYAHPNGDTLRAALGRAFEQPGATP
jgi:integrase